MWSGKMSKTFFFGVINLQIELRFNYSPSLWPRDTLIVEFNVLRSFKSDCISEQDQYAADVLIYLQARPIIYLVKRIITRLCAKSVY